MTAEGCMYWLLDWFRWVYDETFSGMEKVNFAGGEPFIVKRGAYLGELVRFCKEDLQLPSVTVVSNGSLITEKWFEKYGEFNYHVHILLMDCQSPKNLKLLAANGKACMTMWQERIREWRWDEKGGRGLRVWIIHSTIFSTLKIESFFWSIKLNKIVFMQKSMRLNRNVWKCHNWM